MNQTEFFPGTSSQCTGGDGHIIRLYMTVGVDHCAIKEKTEVVTLSAGQVEPMEELIFELSDASKREAKQRKC